MPAFDPIDGTVLDDESEGPANSFGATEQDGFDPLERFAPINAIYQKAAKAAPEEQQSPTVADYGRASMAGVGGMVRGAGWAAEQVGMEDIGEALHDLGSRSVQYWQEDMTPAAKDALARQFIKKDANGSYTWGDANRHTVGLAIAGSLLPTVAGMGVGGVAAKGLQVAGMGARTAGVIGYGAGEAAVAAPSAGADVHDEVMNTPVEQLAQLPAYQAAYNEFDYLEEDARQLVAKKVVADAAAKKAALGTAASTFALSAPAGAVLGKATAGIPLATTRARSIGTGALAEGSQEFAQSGAEQLNKNAAIQEYADPNRDMMHDVLNQAVGGAAAGGMMGGAVGSVTPTEQVSANTSEEANEAPVETGSDIAGYLEKLPPEPIAVDREGRAYTANDQRQMEEQKVQTAIEREKLGMTPDIEANIRRHQKAIAIDRNEEAVANDSGEAATPKNNALSEAFKQAKQDSRIKSKAKKPKQADMPLQPANTVVETGDRILRGGNKPFSTYSEAVAMSKIKGKWRTHEPVTHGDGYALVPRAKAYPAEELPAAIDSKAHEAATSPTNDLPEPTDAQKEAGNYKLGHVKAAGMDISIENPKGSTRSGVSPDGKRWENKLQSHYGYIKRTEGADGDHVDVFIGDVPDVGSVYVVDQIEPSTGAFDEHKAMLGFDSEESARKGYLANYTKDWKGLGAITEMPVGQFKEWVTSGDTKKPLAKLAVPPKVKPAPLPEPKAAPEPASEPVEKPEVVAKAKPAALDEKQTAAGAEKIEDFGEVLHGARKHYAEKLTSVSDLDIAAQPLSKSWPEPDYKKLIDTGANSRTVGFVRAAREEIPAKPSRTYKLESWTKNVQELRQFAADLLDDKYSMDDVERKINTAASHLKPVLYKALLYDAIGHDLPLKGARVRTGMYRLFEGKEFNPAKRLFSLEYQRKPTAFSNMPNVVAHAESFEDLVKAVKKKAPELLKQASETPKVSTVKFGIFHSRKNTGKFVIGKKIGRNVVEIEAFDSIDAARQYLRDNHEQLEQKLAKIKDIPDVRRAKNSPRVGDDHRAGRDISPEEFQVKFGFRGVQFGNYVEGPRRQSELNEAYDALMDLAGMLDIPTRAISLNGSLGLAFGARGKGGKRAPKAHFEPGTVVINLTKRDGAGSLAHEWWHALDNYFSRAREDKQGFVTDFPRKKFPGDNGIRDEMLDAFSRVMEAIKSTSLRQRAAELDRRRTKTYWTTGVEMSARSFESYVINKLEDQSAKNDYLANIVNEAEWLLLSEEGFMLEDSYPYPTAGEIPAIRDAFDHFFDTIQTKEDGDNVALFSRDGAQSVATAGIGRDVINGVIDRVFRESADRQAVVVVERFTDLPESVITQAQDAQYSNENPDDQIRGVFHKGKIYLVQENIASEIVAEQALLHEALHRAMRIGGSPVAMLNHLYLRVGGSAGLSKLAKQVGMDMSKYDAQAERLSPRFRKALLMEEVLAHAEESRAGEAFPAKVKRAIVEFWGKFRSWLERNGFTQLAAAINVDLASFNNADLAYLLKGIREGAQSHPRRTARVIKTDSRFSRTGGWKDFPDAIIPHRGMSNHPDYEAAKAGDTDAGLRLARDLVTPDYVKSVKKIIGDKKPIIVPVRSVEQGDVANAIPETAAVVLAAKLGLDFDESGIRQVENIGRSGGDGFYRLANQPTFTGNVEPRDYIILDDTLTQGGTLAQLKEYIERNGGRVLLATSLTGKQYSARIALEDELLKKVRDEYGELEDWWTDTFGYGFEGLTQSEARYILNANLSPYTLRERIISARIAGTTGVLQETDSGRVSGPETGRVSDSEKPGQDAGFFDSEDMPLFSRVSREAIIAAAKNRSENIPDIGEIKEFAKSISKDKRPWLLAWMTRRQIQDVYGKVFKTLSGSPLEAYSNLVQSMEAYRAKKMHEAEKIADAWNKLGKETQALSDVMHLATIFEIHPDQEAFTTKTNIQWAEKKIAKAKRRILDAPGDVNKKHWDTIEQMGQAIEFEKSRSAMFEQIRDDYLALSDTAKKLYAEARDAHTSQWEEMRDALIGRIDRSVSNKKVKQEMIDRVRQQFEKALEHGPYFPLARFGDYLLIAKKENEHGVLQDYERLHFTNSYDRKKEARRLQREGFTIELLKREQYNEEQHGVSASFVLDVMKMLDENHVKAPGLKDDLNQLMLQHMPDTSFRKHMIHRKKTKGFSKDAPRAYAHAMFHGYHHVGRIKFADQMSSQLELMRKAIRPSSPEDGSVTDADAAVDVLNEMNQRHDMIMNPKGSAFANSLNSLGFVWYLGLSPAAGIVNLSQTWLIAFPQLAARYGFKEAASQLTRATGEFMSAPFKATTDEAWKSLARSKKLSVMERKMIDALHEDGSIETTQVHDLAGLSQTDQFAASASYRPAYKKSMRYIGAFFHNAEVMNREVTALAAYRLAKKSGRGHQDAMQVARKAIWDGHFDYASSNRARMMAGNWQRVIMQFKQYSQNMIYTLVRSASLAWKGETPEVRAAAKRELAGILGMHAVFAGGLGLPMMSVLTAILDAALSDPDDPFDSEAAIRNYLADIFGTTASEALTKGVVNAFTPLDLHGRVSLNSLIMYSPDKSLEGREQWAYYLQQLAGPMAGIASNAFAAKDDFESQQYWRGFERMVPKHIKDAAKAMRYATEGVNTYSGDPLVEDISMTEVLSQVAGFQPSRLAKVYDAQEILRGKKAKLTERRGLLMNWWYRAYEDKDRDEMRHLDEQIRHFNEVNPQLRITRGKLMMGLRSRRRAMNQTEGGIYLPKSWEYMRDEVRFSN